MVMDYVLNPMICTIYCSKVAMTSFRGCRTRCGLRCSPRCSRMLNLRGVKASARTNEVLAIGMFVVVMLFVGGRHSLSAGRVARARPTSFGRSTIRQTFSLPAVLTGASIACLTYIGFDGISTLSEEVENPRRNILLATVLTCLITGVLASILVYLGAAVWGNWTGFPDVDTAFVHVAGKAGGAVAVRAW